MNTKEYEIIKAWARDIEDLREYQKIIANEIAGLYAAHCRRPISCSVTYHVMELLKGKDDTLVGRVLAMYAIYQGHDASIGVKDRLLQSLVNAGTRIPHG